MLLLTTRCPSRQRHPPNLGGSVHPEHGFCSLIPASPAAAQFGVKHGGAAGGLHEWCLQGG